MSFLIFELPSIFEFKVANFLSIIFDLVNFPGKPKLSSEIPLLKLKLFDYPAVFKLILTFSVFNLDNEDVLKSIIIYLVLVLKLRTLLVEYVLLDEILYNLIRYIFDSYSFQQSFVID